MARKLRLGLTTVTVVFGLLAVSLDAIVVFDAVIMAALGMGYAVVAVYGGRRIASTVYETLSTRVGTSAAAVVTGVVAVLMLMTGVVVIAAVLRLATDQLSPTGSGS